MTFELHIRAHPFWAGLQLRFSWGSSWFAGSLVIPFCRLSVQIHRDDAANTLSMP